MIGSATVWGATQILLTGLSCGLTAKLLKGKTIANWTWMSADMTFQRGALIGSSLALFNIFHITVKQHIVNRMQNHPFGKPVIACYDLLFLVGLSSSGRYYQIPFLSGMTFQYISELSLNLLNSILEQLRLMYCPFYHPPDWNLLDKRTLPASVKFRFEKLGIAIVNPWIALTTESYSATLNDYQAAILLAYKQKPHFQAEAVTSFTPVNGQAFLLKVTESTQQWTAISYQLGVVQAGYGYTLVVGALQRDFNDYVELFSRVLCSLRLGNNRAPLDQEKIEKLNIILQKDSISD
jgi:hypothetical protein